MPVTMLVALVILLLLSAVAATMLWMVRRRFQRPLAPAPRHSMRDTLERRVREGRLPL
jgi:heme/copper-type cytochrome/quinol oxidase subunit 2